MKVGAKGCLQLSKMLDELLHTSVPRFAVSNVGRGLMLPKIPEDAIAADMLG